MFYCNFKNSEHKFIDMADVHDKITRSYNMSRIKGKNTSPEILVRKHLFSKGFRFRLHNSKLTGKPDIILPKYKTVIFVNGCFWHGHENCRYAVTPKTRTEFWKSKINRTKERDKNAHLELSKSGWNVLVVWECKLKTKEVKQTLNRIIDEIRDKRSKIYL